MAGIGFYTKRLYDKIDRLDDKVVEMEKSLVRVITIIDEINDR